MELFGCLVAIGGGIVIGAMYRGIDMKEAAVGALQYSQLAPASSDSVALPATARSQPAAASAGDASVTLQPTITLTLEQREQLTREYWDALNSIMATEAAHRAAQPETGPLLHSYLAHRYEGHRRAADELAKLNRHGVDGHVAAYAIRVQAWHEEGAVMYAHAKNLVTDAPSAQVSGPFAEQWQSSSTQHQMEGRLLADKHVAVQSYLDHAHRETGSQAPQAE
jgi:hypothetical protein